MRNPYTKPTAPVAETDTQNGGAVEGCDSANVNYGDMTPDQFVDHVFSLVRLPKRRRK